MDKSKKQYITILILIGIILIEPFLSLHIGSQVIVNKHQYNIMKHLSDKYSRQEKIVNKIKRSFLFKLDEKKLLEGSLRGIISGFDDPYTFYLSKKEYDDLSSQLDGSFCGIGVTLNVAPEMDSLDITYVFPKSPALEVGLKKGDRIIKINDEPIDITKFSSLEEISNKIKGEENTTVKITIKREDDIIDFDITRRQTEIPNVYSKQVNDIGYIRLTNFDNNSSKNFKSTLDRFINNQIQKLIIDLRGNPGGLITEATKICDIFLPPNTLITYTKNNKNISSGIKSSPKTNPISLPTVIITDWNSASASELFSAMMKDYKLATIIGSSTFGKGLVQIFENLDDGSAIKFTAAEYFSPKGNKIDKIGVIPDIDLKSEMIKQQLVISPDLDNLSDDVCFNKALDILNSIN